MPAPGISVVEIWNALVKCKDVINAFRDGYQNAGTILTGFNEELEEVEKALEFQAYVYEVSGRRYPGLGAFQRKLEECAEYVAERHSLLRQHSGVGESLQRVFHTVMSAFEHDLPVFRQALAYNMQYYLNWKMDLLLELSFARAEQPVAAASSQPSIRNYEGQDGDQIQRDVDNLVSIIYTYNRQLGSGNLAAAARNPPTGSSGSLTEDELAMQRLNARFYSTIASICRNGNLPNDYRPPDVSLQALSRHLATSRQRAVIESSSGTSRSLSRSPMVFPRMADIDIIIPFSEKERPHTLRAYGYVLIGSQFIFLDPDGWPIYEHRCRPKTKPLTQRHRDEQDNEMSVVEFLEEQDVSILRSTNTGGSRLLTQGTELSLANRLGQQDEAFKIFPMYEFLGEHRNNNYMQLQSDIRGLILVQEFHASSLVSKCSSAGNDADNVRVKLWKSATDPDKTSLSSLAEFTNRAVIYEWPLRWFEPPQARAKGKTTVRLKFKAQPATPTSRPADGSPGWKRLFRRSSSNGNTATLNSEGRSQAVNVASSIRSVDTMTSSHEYATSEWVQRIEYLDFTLESPSECTAFISEITKLQNPTQTSSEHLAQRIPALIELPAAVVSPAIANGHEHARLQNVVDTRARHLTVTQGEAAALPIPTNPTALWPTNPSPSLHHRVPSESLFDSPELSPYLSSSASPVASSGTSLSHESPHITREPNPAAGSADQPSDMMGTIGEMAAPATPAELLRGAPAAESGDQRHAVLPGDLLRRR